MDPAAILHDETSSTSFLPVNETWGTYDQRCDKTEASGKAFSSPFLGYHRHSWKRMVAVVRACTSVCEENHRTQRRSPIQDGRHALKMSLPDEERLRTRVDRSLMPGIAVPNLLLLMVHCCSVSLYSLDSLFPCFYAKMFSYVRAFQGNSS